MNCKPRLWVLHELTYIQLNVFTFIYTIYLLFIGKKTLSQLYIWKSMPVTIRMQQWALLYCLIQHENVLMVMKHNYHCELQHWSSTAQRQNLHISCNIYTALRIISCLFRSYKTCIECCQLCILTAWSGGVFGVTSCLLYTDLVTGTSQRLHTAVVSPPKSQLHCIQVWSKCIALALYF